MGSSVRHVAEQQKWKNKIPDIYKSTKKRSSLVFNQAHFEGYARSLFIIHCTSFISNTTLFYLAGAARNKRIPGKGRKIALEDLNNNIGVLGFYQDEYYLLEFIRRRQKVFHFS